MAVAAHLRAILADRNKASCSRWNGSEKELAKEGMGSTMNARKEHVHQVPGFGLELNLKTFMELY